MACSGASRMAWLLRGAHKRPGAVAIRVVPAAALDADYPPKVAAGALPMGTSGRLAPGVLAPRDHPPPVADGAICRQHSRQEPDALARTSGSVRGAPGNRRSYRESQPRDPPAHRWGRHLPQPRRGRPVGRRGAGRAARRMGGGEALHDDGDPAAPARARGHFRRGGAAASCQLAIDKDGVHLHQLAGRDLTGRQESRAYGRCESSRQGKRIGSRNGTRTAPHRCWDWPRVTRLSVAGPFNLRTRAPDTTWRHPFSHDRSFIPSFLEW